MTEKQHIALVKAGNSFWSAFGRLVGKTLNSIPEVPEEDAIPYLQDKTSIYGSNFRQRMKRTTKL